MQVGETTVQALARDADHILSAPRLQAPLKRPKRYVISATELAAA
jgi:hypothetical protein